MKVDKNLCPANHPCPSARVCPVGAITQDGFLHLTGLPKINNDICIKCNKCVQYCPMGAISA